MKISKILVFVNLGQPNLAASHGTGDLASMVTANSDINMNGFALVNVKSIAGMSGLWNIDENGNITAQKVETQALTVGGGVSSGVTIYDRQTTAPTCIYIEGGVIKTSGGACGTTQNAGVVAPISETIPSVATSTPPVATSTPPSSISEVIPATASSTSDIIPGVATTTPEVLPTPTTTPEIIIPPADTATTTP